ncbi:holotricin-3-like [Penaeus japonicus]|uniref:holotricin-3-like n=1 Tax=Penaeus japonicus TaxID=27405 RepID=UPI001C712AA0|nr:holotricin-3-like [Penaeus japonicus]
MKVSVVLLAFGVLLVASGRADPLPDAEPGHFHGSFSSGLNRGFIRGFGGHGRGFSAYRGKRSAEASPEPIALASAEPFPEADPAHHFGGGRGFGFGGFRSHGTFGGHGGFIGSSYRRGKRSAEADPEADPGHRFSSFHGGSRGFGFGGHGGRGYGFYG